MPSLNGAGIRVGLATHELDPTLTEKVELRKGYKAAEKCGSVEKLLYGSVNNLLHEERVPFPGEDGDYGLHWLGDVPFFQVSVGGRHSEKVQRMGRTRTNKEGAENTLEESEKAGDAELRALILHIILTEKSFRFPLDNTTQHLKIEVLFNGQLANCVLVQLNEIRTGVKKLHQVFSGTRIDYLTERPWIYTPDKPTEAATGTAGAEARWTEISNVLMTEASKRGIDGNGETSPTARYIRDLASMEMPEGVRQMQRQGGVKFGTIDVVVSVGHGRKTVQGVTYLKAPMRLDDPEFSDEARQHSDGNKFESGMNRKASATPARQDLTKDDTTVKGGAKDVTAVVPSMKDDTVKTAVEANSQKPTWRCARLGLAGSIFLRSAETLRYTNTPTNTQPSLSLPQLDGPASEQTRSDELPSLASYGADQYDSFNHTNLRQSPVDIIEGMKTSSPKLPSVLEVNNGHLPMAAQTLLPEEIAYSSESRPSVDSIENAPPKHPYFKIPFSVPRDAKAASAEAGFDYTQDYERQLDLAKEQRFYGPSLPYLRYSSTSPTDQAPPMGLYKVTEKPKTELSTILRFRAAKANIKVKRLVIQGADGKTIVDQKWKEPKCIPFKTTTSRAFFSLSRLTVEVEKGDTAKLVVKIRGLPRSNIVAVMPSSITSSDLPVNGGRVNPASLSRRHTIDDAMRPSWGTPQHATSSPLPVNPIVSRSSSNIEKRSVPNEGSAHPRWLDPLLRDMTPQPQSCRKGTYAVVISDGLPNNVGATTTSPTPVPSSRFVAPSSTSPVYSPPLLQAHEPNESPVYGGRIMTSSSPISVLSRTPQLSLSSDSVVETIEETRTESSSRLLASKLPTAMPTVASNRPQRSAVTRKRKLSPDSESESELAPESPAPTSQAKRQRPYVYVKPPRSPDRLDASTNLPINEDCAIRLATSEKMGGALRQIKSQRAGTFTEAGVVVGVRYFVVG